MITSFVTRAINVLLLILAGFCAQAQLTANFNTNVAGGCAPLLVNFTDQSAGDPTHWKWDLGNGTISFLQNPSVSYFNPGFYTIKLVVTNVSGTDSITKVQLIEVAGKPVSQFNASITTGCFPLNVQFTDESSSGADSIVTWQWDFGDGHASSLQHPAHVYANAGNYNVTLRVINNKGCLTTFSKTEYIRVSGGANANFTHSAPNVCSAPVTINFKSTPSPGSAITYNWSFGDGTFSAMENPSHIYTIPGSYTVQLTATNENGCTDTITKANAISVGNVFPAITVADQVCAGTPVKFTNSSTPAPSSSSWSFGDGSLANQLNPLKTFSTPGTYQVKLVSNFGSCLDSAFKTVQVVAKPKAAFTSSDSTSCNDQLTVQFKSQSTGAVAYHWNFGDNTSSAEEAPVHRYTAFGNYAVTLVITNENGCTDTVTKPAHIRLVKPRVTLGNLPDSGCVPFTKKFSSSTTSLGVVTGYFWDFGDGGTSTLATPTHTYTAVGKFMVRLITITAGGCRDTTVLINAITTTGRPVANFEATPRNACATVPINFTDNSTGNPTRWLWHFGDGNTSVFQHPKHIYKDTGTYDISLIVWNSGCSDTVAINDYVHVNPPIARFLTKLDCNKAMERVFVNNSVGADESHWDFGDGQTSTEKNPVHVYAVPGTYVVTLLVRNTASGCEFTTKQSIEIANPVPLFSAADTIVCKGRPITFNPTTGTGTISAFNWNFGDGSTITSATAGALTHIYKAAGNFTVRLIITDVLGCKDTLSKTGYIRVDGPTAAFTPSVPGTCLNTQVSFSDASVSDGSHPIESWSWNYADGLKEVLSAGPFQHTYTQPGSYRVALKITDSKGCTDSTIIATPLVISKPAAKFTTLDSVTCPSKQVRFANQSTGPSLTYQWNFGDGGMATAQHPVYNYGTDGTYNVSLKITDRFGCTDSLSKASIVSIVTPVAAFTMSDSFSTCPPLIVQFTNTSQHSISQIWDFGDGTSATIAQPSHFYNLAGTYTVTLTVTAKGGCKDVMKKDIVIKGPKGTFTYNNQGGCNPVTVDFTATTRDRLSFIWDYNDGTTLATTDSVVSHTYKNPGSYVPKMILTDANGCQVPITGKDTIVVYGVTAGLTFPTQALCDRGTVNFQDSTLSNDVITSYSWSFGNGQKSNLKNPAIAYASTGSFYPSLVVTTLHGCRDSIVAGRPVKIVASPQVAVSSTANGCTPVVVTFKGLATVVDTSALNWQWNFGNGNLSTLQNPLPQLYDLAGVYTPTLVVTNSSGCKDTAVKAIEAYRIPVVNAGPDTTICNKVGVTLQATGAATYNWSQAKGLSCTNCASPVATPDSATRFIVRGTTIEGCSATDTILVKVQYAFVLKVSKPDTLCKGQSARLFASGTDQFQWSPATGLSNSSTALPICTPDTTTTYRIIGSDQHGCFKDTAYVPIKVYPIPVVKAGEDKKINIGQSIDLVPTISADVTTVNWSPTGSVFRSTYPGISVRPNQNTVYAVEARNRGGCAARDEVTVYVLCNGTNVFIPNTFSPNGDGSNDAFYPRGTGLFKVKSMRLFNRWGEKVFEKTNFDANNALNGWDGSYRGTRLGADVFVYMIEIICDNNAVLTYNGNVALLQ